MKRSNPLKNLRGAKINFPLYTFLAIVIMLLGFGVDAMFAIGLAMGGGHNDSFDKWYFFGFATLFFIGIAVIPVLAVVYATYKQKYNTGKSILSALYTLLFPYIVCALIIFTASGYQEEEDDISEITFQ